MAYGFEDMISGIEATRAQLFKHIDGISDEQWVWKPYVESKSIGESIKHLVWGDTETLRGLKDGGDPDYSTVPSGLPTESRDELLAQIKHSHSALVSHLKDTYASSPLDTMVSFYGHETKLGELLSGLRAEDTYHTGQIAFVRMATDPSWDYYTAIYS